MTERSPDAASRASAPRDADERRARGDWQTPLWLARAVVAWLDPRGPVPDTVIEPTCGEGAFLVAAAERWPRAKLLGLDRDAQHLARARDALAGRAELRRADLFTEDWPALLRGAQGRLLVLGNPPWVTTTTLGGLGADAKPAPGRHHGLTGLDAITGRSNFDVSEWLWRRLLEARPASARLALLTKTAVARRLLAHLAAEAEPAPRGDAGSRTAPALRARAGAHPLQPELPLGDWLPPRAGAASAGGLPTGALVRIDAKRAFGAAVSAALLVLEHGAREPASDAPARRGWAVYSDLDQATPSEALAVRGGVLTAHPEAFERTRWLSGRCSPEWRSGLKHDCAAVMELVRRGDAFLNGLDEVVEIEPEVLYPLLKGSDVAHQRAPGARWVIVPQRSLGESTADLRARAPRAWAYLHRHRERLAARKSRVYAGRGEFALFGIGAYTFAPFKVAICGLYTEPRFALVGPFASRPALLDDTCYFLPFEREPDARRAFALLTSEEARTYLEARTFRDDKRPFGKRLLQTLDLDRLAESAGQPRTLGGG